MRKRRIEAVGWALALVCVMAGCGGAQKNLRAGPMPTGGTFTGVWYSPQWGEMHLIQTGVSVIGAYEKDQRRGRIQGQASGNLLRFQWTEKRELVSGRPNVTRGRGYFTYKVGEDGKHYLLGEWGFDDRNSGGGSWNAYKLAKREPKVGSAGEKEEVRPSSDETFQEHIDLFEGLE